ncbi:isochorismatase [bacterium]|nr:isochorismatase [bacterium]
MSGTTLPIPDFFQSEHVGEIRRMEYQSLASRAVLYRKEHRIKSASQDRTRIALVLIDLQNTFCIPGFELYVGGHTGTAAVDDNVRLCQFIYRQLGSISTIFPTMDTHQAGQIFHSIFLINDEGEHPAPYTVVSVADLENGTWRFNTELGPSLHIAPEHGQHFLEHYTRSLQASGKYALTIWPYHAMLGGIGHALVPAVEEAIFFHGQVRSSQPGFELKGLNPLTENYSVFSPEVVTDENDQPIGSKNRAFLEKLIEYEAVIIAGQAKSHCVAWTVADLLREADRLAPGFADKIYLLEDCTSAVVIPGVIDYSVQAEAAFRSFAERGVHCVRSTEPPENWPGFPF